jgi:hypothetical protein
MGISEALAASHVSNFMETVNRDTSDPRNSRVEFLQWAQSLSSLASGSTNLQQALLAVEDALHGQIASAQALAAAKSVGWPSISGIPDGPANLIYAVGRLAAHSALTTTTTAQQMRESAFNAASLPSADNVAEQLRDVASTLEPDFISTLLTQAVTSLKGEDNSFATRMAQAAQDVGALVTGNELPEFLINLVESHVARAAPNVLRVPDPTEVARKSPPPWHDPLRAWIPAARLSSDIWKTGDGNGDNGDGDGAAGEGTGGAAAIICVVGTATAGLVVPLVVCVAVLIAIVIITIVSVSTKHP